MARVAVTAGLLALAAFAAGFSLALADAGVPEAVWFWRDILGVHVR